MSPNLKVASVWKGDVRWPVVYLQQLGFRISIEMIGLNLVIEYN